MPQRREATKDRHDREAIVAALRDALRNGDTSLVGNKSYRCYLKSTGHWFDVDETRIAADARFDEKLVLTTNTGLDPRATTLTYRQLWMVESIFRFMKSVLETRPVYHKCDRTIRGHLFCSFLALVLRKWPSKSNLPPVAGSSSGRTSSRTLIDWKTRPSQSTGRAT